MCAEAPAVCSGWGSRNTLFHITEKQFPWHVGGSDVFMQVCKYEWGDCGIAAITQSELYLKLFSWSPCVFLWSLMPGWAQFPQKEKNESENVLLPWEEDGFDLFSWVLQDSKIYRIIRPFDFKTYIILGTKNKQLCSFYEGS